MNLPPEMQQRIADIIEKQRLVHQQAQPQERSPVAPPTRPPTLMDHTVALRQEVAALLQRTSCCCSGYRCCWSSSRSALSNVSRQSEVTDQSGNVPAGVFKFPQLKTIDYE